MKRPETTPPDACTLIDDCCIVQGPFLPVLDHGFIVVKDGKILAIGANNPPEALYPAATKIDGRGFIAMPGLMNAHTHVALGFFRGMGHGRQNMIESFLFPAEKSLTPELLEPLSYSYIYDGLRSGVTSFVDHYYFSHGVARAFESLGVRGWIGETIADLGGAFPGYDSWRRAQDLMANGHFSSLISHVIAPHAADTISKSLLTECAKFASEHRLPLHMHLSQTAQEFARVQSAHGVSPVEFADVCGALTPQSLVVHLTSATTSDLALIKARGSAIGYCPSSTMIYDHLADISEFYRLDIPLAIGTDCAASCDHADVLSELRTAALMGHDRGVDVAKLSPDHLLASATTVPARVLGREHDLGTLEVGKCADLVLIKKTLNNSPAENILTNILFSSGARDVHHVMINGQWVLWNKEVTMQSHEYLQAQFSRAVAEIHRRIK